MIGDAPSSLSRLTESKELTVIKVLNARLTVPLVLAIDFSDHSQGVVIAD